MMIIALWVYHIKDSEKLYFERMNLSMKKVLCLSMTIILLLSLYCCGGQPNESDANISDLQSQIESAQTELSNIESNSGDYRESLVSLIDDYESQISNIESNNSVAAHESVVSSSETTNSHTKTESVASHKHSYTSNRIEATCTKNGTITYTCLCGDTYTETIPAKGHNYKITVTSATCTAKGYTDYKCTNCGNSYVDNYTNALGHSTDDGTCSRCGINIIKIGSLSSPLKGSSGINISYQEYSFYSSKIINVTVEQVITGSTANNLANSENRFNETPSSTQEWKFYIFNIEYISSNGGNDDVLKASDIIYGDKLFTLTGSSYPIYEKATLGDKYNAYGVFNVNLYPGSSSKVVIGVLADKGAGDALIKVPYDSGKKNTWIKCTTD